MGLEKFYGLADGYLDVSVQDSDDMSVINVETDEGRRYSITVPARTDDEREEANLIASSMFDWGTPVYIEDPQDFACVIAVEPYRGKSVYSSHAYVLPTAGLTVTGIH